MKKLITTFLISYVFILENIANICAYEEDHTSIQKLKKHNEEQIQRDIEEIENFFNQISTFKADFIEIDRRGRQSSGVFALKKKSSAKKILKMDYTSPPTKIFVVKENKATYYDKELKEKTVTSVYSSPLAFLLDKKVNLKDNLEVVYYSNNKNILSIGFKKKNDKENEYGAVVLTFIRTYSDNREKEKWRLNFIKWSLYRRNDKIDTKIDPEIPVQVYLKNQKINQTIDDKEFE